MHPLREMLNFFVVTKTSAAGRLPADSNGSPCTSRCQRVGAEAQHVPTLRGNAHHAKLAHTVPPFPPVTLGAWGAWHGIFGCWHSAVDVPDWQILAIRHRASVCRRRASVWKLFHRMRGAPVRECRFFLRQRQRAHVKLEHLDLTR